MLYIKRSFSCAGESRQKLAFGDFSLFPTVTPQIFCSFTQNRTMSTSPAPFVHWGQNSKKIVLKILLQDVEGAPDVNLDNKSVSFKANGKGAQGENCYEFQLETFEKIRPEGSQMKVIGPCVQISLPKVNPDGDPWPRLTRDKVKYAWIKPDFDLMHLDDDIEEEEEEENRKMTEEYLKRVTREFKVTDEDAVKELKKNYLFSYSLLQYIGYTFIALRIIYGLAFVEGFNSYEDTFVVVAICQIAAILEVVHPMVGIVKTGVLSPLLQVLGRNLAYFVILYPFPEIQASTLTSTLLLSWSLAEMIRYPFYMMSVMNIDFYWLTWLRYTAWIPLYPMGGGAEWFIAFKSLPFYDASGKYSLALPNFLNFSFYFSWFLVAYLFVQPIMLYKMMVHMYSQRKKKLCRGSSRTPTSQKMN